METRAKIREVASSWIQPSGLSAEQVSAEVAQATHDTQTALRALRTALWHDAQLRVRWAVSGARQLVDNAEIGVERMVCHVPGVGPVIAMEMFNRTHPTRNAEDWATRPSNRVDPEDAAVEARSDAEAYLDCIGMHVA